jgi:hypothetical protein
MRAWMVARLMTVVDMVCLHRFDLMPFYIGLPGTVRCDAGHRKRDFGNGLRPWARGRIGRPQLRKSRFLRGFRR